MIKKLSTAYIDNKISFKSDINVLVCKNSCIQSKFIDKYCIKICWKALDITYCVFNT